MSFSHILVVVDIEGDVEVITALAKTLAKNSAAAFSVLGVAPNFPSPAFKTKKSSNTARQLTEQIVSTLRAKVDQVANVLPAGTSTNMVSGRLAEEVSKAVLINQSDMVVKAASVQPGEPGPTFGSIDKRLIRNCAAPVWVVRPDIGGSFDRIAVAIDRHDIQSDASEREDLNLELIDHAVKLATALGVPKIDIVHAWDAVGADLARSARSGLTPDEAQAYMKEFEDDSTEWLDGFISEAAKKFENAAPKLVPHLVFGRPRRVLVSQIEALEADVLIMGTIARSGALGLLIGNTAEDVLDRVRCSVLAIKPAFSK